MAICVQSTQRRNSNLTYYSFEHCLFYLPLIAHHRMRAGSPNSTISSCRVDPDPDAPLPRAYHQPRVPGLRSMSASPSSM